MTNAKDSPAGKLADWLNKLGIDVWRGKFGVGSKVDWAAIAEKLEAAAMRRRQRRAKLLLRRTEKKIARALRTPLDLDTALEKARANTV